MSGDRYSAGQAGAIGPGAHAHHMTFQQIWNQSASEIDLSLLARELSTLRQSLKFFAFVRHQPPHFQSRRHDVAQAEIVLALVGVRSLLVGADWCGEWKQREMVESL